MPALANAPPKVGSMNVRDIRPRGPACRSDNKLLPETLSRLIGPSLDSVPWRWMAPGVRQVELPLSSGASGYLSLIRIDSGRAIPEHGHGATELTLVLRGAFRDERGEYHVGDLADVDSDVDHKPVVIGDEPCICLIASEQRPQFRGIVSRVLQRLIS